MKVSFTLAVIAAIAVLIPVSVAAQTDVPVVVIGDSLNDTGTFVASTMTGRFTNTPGLLWTEIVANRLGGRADPAQVHDGEGFVAIGGTNWAQSGALVVEDGGLYNGLSQSVASQVTAALASHIGAETIVLMDGGGPDVLRAVFAVGQGQMTPDEAVASVQAAGGALADQAKRIEDAGARVVLLNVGNFGVFPLIVGLGEDVAGFADQLSQAFNSSLKERATEIGLKAVRPDIYAWTMDVTTSPGAYGLGNVTQPGCDLARIQDTPTRAGANCTWQDQVSPDAANTYLFADDIHGSAASHRLIAEYVLTTMEPAGWLVGGD
jgi:outer membrane lipase/esterase